MLTICTDNHEAPGDESIQVKVTTLTAKTKMMYWYSSTQRNQVSGQSSPCHHHTAGTKRVRSKKVGGEKRNMARRNQRTGRNIHLPSFTRRREKPNIFRTVLSLQFSSVQLRTEPPGRVSASPVIRKQVKSMQRSAGEKKIHGVGWETESWRNTGDWDQEPQTNPWKKNRPQNATI